MEQVMNGVQKPQDVIAKGPHVYIEAEHRYVERPVNITAYPRVMYHETQGEKEIQSGDQQEVAEAQGWRTSPFAKKPVDPSDHIPAIGGDLAIIVMQQMAKLQEQSDVIAKQGQQIDALMSAQAEPEAPKRGPGRPPKTPTPEVA